MDWIWILKTKNKKQMDQTSKRLKKVLVALTEQEYQIICETSQITGLPVSSLLRSSILEKAKKVISENKKLESVV